MRMFLYMYTHTHCTIHNMYTHKRVNTDRETATLTLTYMNDAGHGGMPGIMRMLA